MPDEFSTLHVIQMVEENFLFAMITIGNRLLIVSIDGSLSVAWPDDAVGVKMDEHVLLLEHPPPLLFSTYDVQRWLQMMRLRLIDGIMHELRQLLQADLSPERRKDIMESLRIYNEECKRYTPPN